MNEQLSLLDIPAVQVDETHWEIYDGKKLIGTFECDGTRFEYFSTVGYWAGVSGTMWLKMDEHLQAAIDFLCMRYRLYMGA